MEGGGAVEEDGMALGHLFQDVPHFRRLALDHLWRRTDGMDIAQFLQAADDERLEEDQGHFLGQAALVAA